MPLVGDSEETASTGVELEPSERSAALRSRMVRVAIWPRSALVTTSTSGISVMPDFRNCSTSPLPGCTTTTTVSATSAISVSPWPDPDRLDDDHVECRRERVRRGAGGRGQSPQPLAGGGRADQNPAVGGVELDARSIAEQRAARAARAGIDGEDRHGPPLRAPCPQQG